ncbi:nucleic acid-binding protein [Cylindrobasidium torrendii FP15055 ss-10]|uniref:Nucleic acid-binding protein n=1 Tax=Cylindrobasidium torrendii FP15055 ss-10 TaxID=1314674 RepID=A0A0D7BDC1_9AGAR|nr:nucleic acid-binding protein [Cylindrobasidium torrendii FP15055 ss-10]
MSLVTRLARFHRLLPGSWLSTMAAPASLSKLAGPVRDLVSATIENDPTLVGKNDADKASVSGWLEKVGAGDLVKAHNFKSLDADLISKTYLVSNYSTAADIALYGSLHPSYAQLSSTQYFSTPALTRYFDHIQSLPVVRTSADKLASFPVVTLDLANAPVLPRAAEPAKKKKEPKATGSAPAAPAAAETATKASASEPAPAESNEKPLKTQKKEKKEKKKDGAEGGGKGGKQAAPAEDAGPPVPSMIDLRVGKIVEVKKHPDADSLYVEQIDLGEETGPRTVVSGLVKYIPIEEMQDKYLVAVCNLKPAAMRGIKSFAMVLAATSPDGKDGGVELIAPPPGSKVGDRVYFEGFESGQAVSQLNPKKKIFETIQPGFTTLDTKEAAWVNPETKTVHKIRTESGICVAPNFVGASLS